MIAIVDYGVGNLFSLKSSFAAIGAEDVKVTSNAGDLRAAERIILPGVGAFGDAAKKLRSSGLAAPLLEEARRGKPFLGVCLGMQLLFERSFEYGEHEGLGLIPGEIRPISEVIPAGLKIPHIGWNALRFNRSRCEAGFNSGGKTPPETPAEKSPCPLFAYIKEGDCVYFVHSYSAFCPSEFITATTEYGADLTAAVQRGNVYGCQFHPEKSGTVGLNILRAFCGLDAGGQKPPAPLTPSEMERPAKSC